MKGGHRWAPCIAMFLALVLQASDIWLLFFISDQLPVVVLAALESFLVHILYAATPLFKIWQARVRSPQVTLLAGIPGVALAVVSATLPALRQTDHVFLVSKSDSL